MTEIKTKDGWIDLYVFDDGFSLTSKGEPVECDHDDGSIINYHEMTIDQAEELRSVLDKQITRYWLSQLARGDDKWILQGY
ncbi:MAG: hypothetical protein CML17_02365 [Pusillimonas sp.]|jgi:hypothetical protein|nr:hypothetical protein [Pusillimonas sp.]|tara:strand:+ start:1995 stop:2237 length:243 start_codon:yes stop_codon:yes gene_type:complete